MNIDLSTGSKKKLFGISYAVVRPQILSTVLNFVGLKSRPETSTVTDVSSIPVLGARRSLLARSPEITAKVVHTSHQGSPGSHSWCKHWGIAAAKNGEIVA